MPHRNTPRKSSSMAAPVTAMATFTKKLRRMCPQMRRKLSTEYVMVVMGRKMENTRR